MAGNTIHVQGNYVDVHDNKVVNINMSGKDNNFVSVSDNSVTDNSVNVVSTDMHFGMDPCNTAHWTDVYSRLVSEGLIKAGEVTRENFLWLMCGKGTKPVERICWHGTKRQLAYMVRRYLNSRWDVATKSFNDKNDNALPQSLMTSKPPCPDSAKIIDQIFNKRD